MENSQNTGDFNLSPAQIAFLRLLDSAITEGEIRENPLQFYAEQLKLDPETIGKIREYLLSQNVRIICAGADPQYTEELRSDILALLEQQAELLSEREKLVLTMRLKENKSADEVGALMGVTRERILQVERKTIRLLLHRRRKAERLKKIRNFYE